MLRWLKQRLRDISINFEGVTAEWVVGRDIWTELDDAWTDEEFAAVQAKLEDLHDKWGTDPEITRAMTLVSFMTED